MTIRSRNRTNIFIITISILIFAIETALIGYKILTKSFIFPSIYFQTPSSTNFLTGYKDIYVFSSIVYLQLYAIGISIYLWRGFEKTQSSEVAYLLTFLSALIFDSARLLIPFLYSQGPYSKLIFILGNSVVLARILAPVSLLCVNIFSNPDDRQYIERNILLIFVTSILYAVYIPVNTAIVLPNYSFQFSFANILIATSIIISILTTLTIVYRQYKNSGKQTISIGYSLLCAGYLCLFNCTNLLHLILGVVTMTTGTIMYLYSLHNNYM